MFIYRRGCSFKPLSMTRTCCIIGSIILVVVLSVAVPSGLLVICSCSSVSGSKIREELSAVRFLKLVLQNKWLSGKEVSALKTALVGV